jgi:acyl-homoserine-lactone acylase
MLRIPLGAFLSLAILATGCARPRPTEILWDTWGVPHIYSATDVGVFEAFGYAQAASHGDLVLRLYAQARGRAAEFLGPAHLDSDRYIRTMGVPGRAAEWLAAQTPAFRANLEAFATGFNRFATDHPGRISDSVKSILPVSATDVMAHAQRVVHFVFVYGIEQAQALFSRPGTASDAGSNT